MSSSEDIVATAALVVALVAMLIASLQLVAQIAATAEGTRKCSYSVLGPWCYSTKPNTKTIWKRFWREGRLETRYVAPEIGLTTSGAWVNYEMYHPKEQSDNKDKWEADSEWCQDITFPSSKVRKMPLISYERKSRGSSRSPDVLDRLLWSFRPSLRPLTPDCLLGGDIDLDVLLSHPDYDIRGSDRVGWISFMTFLRLEMEDHAIKTVIQQRWWDRYPAYYVVKPGIKEAEKGQKPKKIPIAPNSISWPKIKFVQRSWDFVPPDVTKPLASSTVGDIAVLVRRTGMIWKAFEPFTGNMNAEGGPHVISSIQQKGLGIVLSYQCLDESLTGRVRARRKHPESSQSKLSDEQVGVNFFTKRIFPLRARNLASDVEELSVSNNDLDSRQEQRPNYEAGGVSSSDLNFEEGAYSPHGPWPKAYDLCYVGADKRLFGLVPSDPAFEIQDFRHGTKKECWDELKQLCLGDEAAVRHIDHALWIDRYEFNDILMMVPEVSRQRGKIRSAYHTVHYNANVMIWTTKTFTKLITSYLDGEEILENLGCAQDGRPMTYRDGERKNTRLPGRVKPPTAHMEFARQSMDAINDGKAKEEDQVQYLEGLHSRHERTTAYFVSISDRIPFMTLLRMHFSSAIWASWQARTDVKDHNHTGCLPKSEGHPWRNRNIELYFCYLPRYIEFMAQGKDKTKCTDTDLVIEAWLMLMTRAYLFRELEGTANLDGGYLPSEFYGSRFPVWLM